MTASSFPALALARRATRLVPLLAWLTLTALVTSACGGGSAGSVAGAPTGIATLSAAPSLTVTPATANVSIGGSAVSFAAQSPSGTNPGVTWSVNGVAGGDSTVGTISASGQYLSPAVLPSPATIAIAAVSTSDSSQSGYASVTLTSAPPVGVSVAPSSATVTAGAGTQVFAASVSGTGNTAVTWEVNGVAGGNATVGTIATDGLYTAPATPPAQPTVTVSAVSVADPARSASASVLIASAQSAISVAVAPAAVTLVAGSGSQAFTATVLNTSNTAVSWQVNGIAGGNATVGMVNASGVYSAPAAVPNPATVTVTAVSAADSSRSASAAVTLSAASSVSISPSGADVQAGIGSQAFTAAVSNASDPTVVWLVNGTAGGNSTVGTISSSGLYVAPADAPASGTVTVTASLKMDSTRSASANVTVKARIKVAVSPASATARAGTGTQTFVATVSNTSNTAVTWQVNGVTGGSAAIGTITTAGVYAAPTAVPSPASVTITATSVVDPGKPGSATLTVTAPVTVSVSPASASVRAGTGTQTLAVAVANSTNTAVTWQVNGITGGNATVGTISAAGVYAAPATVPSPATVTVTAVSAADPTRSGSAVLTITAPVSVTVSPSIVTLTAGTGSQQFNAIVTNGASGSVTWLVNGANGGNLTVGTISSAGLYIAPAKAPSPATVTVSAQSVDDPTRSANASVTVVAAGTPPTIGGTPPTSATVGTTYSFQPAASGGSGGPLTFSVSNLPAWATFSAATGLLSGTPASGAIGTYANISISVSDGSSSATLAPFTITVGAGSTGSATISWTIPTTRTDGTALTNLAGFNIYYGTSPGNYPTAIRISNPTVSTYVVSNLTSGTYYFVATAYDANGVESAYPPPGSKTIP